MYLCYDIQANIAGQYSIPIAAYKIFSTFPYSVPMHVMRKYNAKPYLFFF